MEVTGGFKIEEIEVTHLKYNFSLKEQLNTFYRAQTSNWHPF